MKNFKEFNESLKREVKLQHKNNPGLIITFDVIDGRIYNIKNNSRMRFPYIEGQNYTRNMESWCCNNNFKLNGEDTCPEPKIFGIKASDVPQGHELRYLFPNKFKK